MRAGDSLTARVEEPALFSPNANGETAAMQPEAGSVPEGVADDRLDVGPADRTLLIIEDDARFARILLEMAREKGFKGLVSSRGEAGLALARKFEPDAIMLDIQLPGMEGWAVLDRLKRSPETRHIPVHIISVQDDLDRGLSLGAFACLQKPVSREALEAAFANIRAFLEREVRDLLVVEDDPDQRGGILELIGDSDVRTTAVGTAREALDAVQAGRFDCMVLDLRLPDMDGLKLIEDDPEPAEPSPVADRRLYGEGSVRGREASPQGAGRICHHQRREVPGAPPGRNGTVPAPGRGQPSGVEEADPASDPGI